MSIGVSHVLTVAIVTNKVSIFSGETLLSPLVMCGPHGLKFLQPVELRLPHCASVNPDSWSFALKSSDSPSGILTFKKFNWSIRSGLFV